jgi:hypothetical protein
MVEASGTPQHPEPELLAAFAERTLTAYERTQMLEHLSGCAACREMLFLAHEVTPEADEAAAAVVVGGRGRFRSWFPAWLPVWSPIAATAVVAVIVASAVGYEHMHQGDVPAVSEGQPATNSQMAMEAPPQPLRQQEAIAAPAPESKATPQEFKVAPSPALPQPPPPPLPIVVSSVGAVMARRAIQPAPQQAGAGAATQSQQVGEMRRWAVSQQTGTGAAAQYAPTAPAASAKVSALPSVGLEIAAPPAPPAAAPIVTTDKIASDSAADMTVMNAATGAAVYPDALTDSLTALRWGKEMVSSVAVGGRRLVLDVHGDLHLSVDGGAKWRKIHKQWKGKATRLSLPSAASSAQTGGHAVLLTNQHQDTWSSADGGETWQAVAKTK